MIIKEGVIVLSSKRKDEPVTGKVISRPKKAYVSREDIFKIPICAAGTSLLPDQITSETTVIIVNINEAIMDPFSNFLLQQYFCAIILV